MNFAVIVNGIVENTIVCDNLELAELATGKTCIEMTSENWGYIGLGYANGVFEKPVELELGE
jgi:hypothetical protein